MISAFLGRYRPVLTALAALALSASLLALPLTAAGNGGGPGSRPGQAGLSSAPNLPNLPNLEGGWRLKIKDAAVTRGKTVLLGEIAEPIGPLTPDLWRKLETVALWPAPPTGKPMNMTRPKIQQAMAHYAGELSSMCIYPTSMTLQQGGAVLDGKALESLVVKTLTPHMRNMPGDASLQDFRLPSALFLSREGQTAELEGPFELTPGRTSLRFAVREPDGSVVRRVTGTVFLDLWAEVPVASVPLNKDEVLGPERVTFARKNLAHIKGAVWDGRGGPWRMQRVVTLGQPIMQADVAVIPTVQKGTTVTMLYEGRNFSVSMPGEALADGARGETIAVRNLNSKKQLRATVRDGLTVVVR